MAGQLGGKKLTIGLVLVSALILVLVSAFSRLAIAQDTSKLVYDRCTECHVSGKDQNSGKSYWEGRKLTDKQWAGVVDNMVRYGARLNDTESRLVITYLSAMSKGNFKSKGTNTRTVKHINFDSLLKAVSTTAAARAPKTQVQAVDTSVTTTTTTTTVPVTTPAVPTVPVAPKQQAKTGVEMIWYLLSGGSLIGSGMALRNKERRKGTTEE